jgi:hypothetical protein
VRYPEVAKPTFLATNEMAFLSVIPFVEGGFMKRNTVLCPVCDRHFDPRTPRVHISKYHSCASESDLKKIRDARRRCFGKSKPLKQKTAYLTIFTTIHGKT